MTRIFIYDTTLRDGSQGEGVNFSLQDKLLITARLDEAGFDYIEGGYPLSNPKDAAYFRAVRDLELKHAKVAAFGMTRRRDIAAEDDQGMKALVGAGTPAITIVGKSWDLHVHDVLGVSLEENLRMIGDSVAFCASHGAEVIYDAEHFFDGLKRNPDYALRTIQAAAAAGAAWIVLCDTNGGALPDEVAEAVVAGRPRGLRFRSASTRTMTATSPWPTPWRPSRTVRRQVQGTINGLGERCGNVDLCSVVGQPGPEVSRLLGSLAGQAGAPDRALALRLRDGQHELPGQPAVCRRQCIRTQGGDARPRRPQERGELRARRPRDRRQRAPGLDQRAVGQVQHRREAERIRPGTGQRTAGSRARPGPGPGERGLSIRGGRGVVRALGRAAGGSSPASGSTRSAFTSA